MELLDGNKLYIGHRKNKYFHPKKVKVKWVKTKWSNDENF